METMEHIKRYICSSNSEGNRPTVLTGNRLMILTGHSLGVEKVVLWSIRDL